MCLRPREGGGEQVTEGSGVGPGCQKQCRARRRLRKAMNGVGRARDVGEPSPRPGLLQSTRVQEYGAFIVGGLIVPGGEG